MTPIYINSRNLVIMDEGNGMRTVVRGNKSEILLIWQILTNAVLKKDGTASILKEFIDMSPASRTKLIGLMSSARKVADSEDEVAQILSVLVEGDNA